jgi:hypothetical protein
MLLKIPLLLLSDERPRIKADFFAQSEHPSEQIIPFCTCPSP